MKQIPILGKSFEERKNLLRTFFTTVFLVFQFRRGEGAILTKYHSLSRFEFPDERIRKLLNICERSLRNNSEEFL